ncbi:UbiA family prenyltransferase [Nocardia blacklockiae]|uniref:UbiA family prenyltransferase n=1 Tax=Nocardia blacklockiae TaxID=480036 RepID=UPI001892F812|nr:UbiA family prenyltransferase [Nocardia blacklockiae]MBF6170833.1 UbiA family prenyltransferase [Nocardia blacklockiae]
MTVSSVAEFRRVFSADRAESTRKLSFARAFRLARTVHRVEVMPLGAGVMTASVVVSAHSWSEVRSVRMLVTIVVLTSYVLLTNVVNCLADRWLDTDFKSRLSRAVTELGVRRVRAWVFAWVAVIAAGVAWLVFETGHFDLVLIMGIGVVFSFQYSLPPLHFKGAGIWQIPAVLVMVTLLPGIALVRTYDRPLEWPVLAALLGLALTVNSVFIVNAAEDVPEDAEHAIVTAPRALGLFPAFVVGLAQLVLGAAVFVAATVPSAGYSWTYIPYLAAVAVGAVYLGRLVAGVRGKTPEAAIEIVRRATSFAVLAMLLSWAAVLPAAAVFANR